MKFLAGYNCPTLKHVNRISVMDFQESTNRLRNSPKWTSILRVWTTHCIRRTHLHSEVAEKWRNLYVSFVLEIYWFSRLHIFLLFSQPTNYATYVELSVPAALRSSVPRPSSETVAVTLVIVPLIKVYIFFLLSGTTGRKNNIMTDKAFLCY